MLCTFIHEKYSPASVREVADSLNNILSPNDNFGWSSAGLYCFWDTKNNEILYIGLALDLASRFRQHNGLDGKNVVGCKLKEITEWFKTNDCLGYSILVQSTLSQPMTFRQDNYSEKADLISKHGTNLTHGHEAIKATEGLLISSHKKHFKSYPRWNKISGSKYGSEASTKEHYYLASLFTNAVSDPLVAISTICELAADEEKVYFEVFLHSIRMSMLTSGITFSEAWCDSPEEEMKERILSNNYINL